MAKHVSIFSILRDLVSNERIGWIVIGLALTAFYMLASILPVVSNELTVRFVEGFLCPRCKEALPKLEDRSPAPVKAEAPAPGPQNVVRFTAQC